jgi:hypothetical protein
LGTDVSPALLAAVEGELVQVVELILEGVDHAPLVDCEVDKEQAFDEAVGRYEAWVGAVLQCDNPPAMALGDGGAWLPLEQGGSYLRKEEAAVDEQRRPALR